jgi:hypothetical protein
LQATRRQSLDTDERETAAPAAPDGSLSLRAKRHSDPGAVASGRYARRRRRDVVLGRAKLASARNMRRPTIAATKMYEAQPMFGYRPRALVVEAGAGADA